MHKISSLGNGKRVEINKDIVNAPPTDGLWDDSRNDESQLGLTYKEIEEAMENKDSPHFEKYNKIREQNLHKMISIPVCKFENKMNSLSRFAPSPTGLIHIGNARSAVLIGLI